MDSPALPFWLLFLAILGAVSVVAWLIGFVYWALTPAAKPTRLKIRRNSLPRR